MIISKTKTQFHSALDLIEIWSSENKIKVNRDKSQILLVKQD